MNKKHPSAWEPAIMLLNILVSVIGSIIGLELIARLGISTNTSIIGALFAIIIARIPLKMFLKYKDIKYSEPCSDSYVRCNVRSFKRYLLIHRYSLSVRKTGSGYSDAGRCFISSNH